MAVVDLDKEARAAWGDTGAGGSVDAEAKAAWGDTPVVRFKKPETREAARALFSQGKTVQQVMKLHPAWTPDAIANEYQNWRRGNRPNAVEQAKQFARAYRTQEAAVASEARNTRSDIGYEVASELAGERAPANAGFGTKLKYDAMRQLAGAAVMPGSVAALGAEAVVNPKGAAKTAGAMAGGVATQVGKHFAHPISSFKEEPISTVMDWTILLDAAGGLAKLGATGAARVGTVTRGQQLLAKGAKLIRADKLEEAAPIVNETRRLLSSDPGVMDAVSGHLSATGDVLHAMASPAGWVKGGKAVRKAAKGVLAKHEPGWKPWAERRAAQTAPAAEALTRTEAAKRIKAAHPDLKMSQKAIIEEIGARLDNADMTLAGVKEIPGKGAAATGMRQVFADEVDKLGIELAGRKAAAKKPTPVTPAASEIPPEPPPEAPPVVPVEPPPAPTITPGAAEVPPAATVDTDAIRTATLDAVRAGAKTPDVILEAVQATIPDARIQQINAELVKGELAGEIGKLKTGEYLAKSGPKPRQTVTLTATGKPGGWEITGTTVAEKDALGKLGIPLFAGDKRFATYRIPPENLEAATATLEGLGFKLETTGEASAATAKAAFGEKTPAPAATPAEPHQMTTDEYFAQRTRTAETPDEDLWNAQLEHDKHVWDAMEEGKEVPDHVRADWPRQPEMLGQGDLWAKGEAVPESAPPPTEAGLFAEAPKSGTLQIEGANKQAQGLQALKDEYMSGQRAIDTAEDALDAAGHDVTKFVDPNDAYTADLIGHNGYTAMPEHLADLYRKRDAVGAQIDAAETAALTSEPIPGPASTEQVNKAIGIVKQELDLGQTMGHAIPPKEEVVRRLYVALSHDLYITDRYFPAMLVGDFDLALKSTREWSNMGLGGDAATPLLKQIDQIYDRLAATDIGGYTDSGGALASAGRPALPETTPSLAAKYATDVSTPSTQAPDVSKIAGEIDASAPAPITRHEPNIAATWQERDRILRQAENDAQLEDYLRSIEPQIGVEDTGELRLPEIDTAPGHPNGPSVFGNNSGKISVDLETGVTNVKVGLSKAVETVAAEVEAALGRPWVQAALDQASNAGLFLRAEHREDQARILPIRWQAEAMVSKFNADGERIADSCTTLAVEMAKWAKKHMPAETAVYGHDGALVGTLAKASVDDVAKHILNAMGQRIDRAPMPTDWDALFGGILDSAPDTTKFAGQWAEHEAAVRTIESARADLAIKYGLMDQGSKLTDHLAYVYERHSGKEIEKALNSRFGGKPRVVDTSKGQMTNIEAVKMIKAELADAGIVDWGTPNTPINRGPFAPRMGLSPEAMEALGFHPAIDIRLKVGGARANMELGRGYQLYRISRDPALASAEATDRLAVAVIDDAHLGKPTAATKNVMRRYTVLENQHVSPYVKSYIEGLTAKHNYNRALNAWQKSVAQWKRWKVTSAPFHLRNFAVGNPIQAYFGTGALPGEFAEAAKFVTSKEGRAALARELVTEEGARIPWASDDERWVETAADVASSYGRKGKLARAYEKSPAGKLEALGGKVFEKTESFYKRTVYEIERRRQNADLAKRGLLFKELSETERTGLINEAIRSAENAIFDYGDRPAWMSWLAKNTGSFGTYTYKMSGLAGRTLATDPARVAVLVRTAQLTSPWVDWTYYIPFADMYSNIQDKGIVKGSLENAANMVPAIGAVDAFRGIGWGGFQVMADTESSGEQFGDWVQGVYRFVAPSYAPPMPGIEKGGSWYEQVKKAIKEPTAANILRPAGVTLAKPAQGPSAPPKMPTMPKGP